MFRKLIDLPKTLSPDLRKLIGNTFWLFSEKIFQMGLGLLVGVWVARYLGPEDFGIFNYALAIVWLFDPVAKLGLDEIVVRDLARAQTDNNETLGTSFVLKISASIVTAFLAFLTIYLLRPEDRQLQILVAIMAAGSIFRSAEIVELWFRSQVQAKYVVWARNIAYIFSNLIKVILIKINAPVVAFAAATFAEYSLAAIGMVIVYQITKNLIQAWRFSVSRAKSLIKDSWPLILSGIVIMIYMRIDQIMLGQMIGDEAVGLYSAAVKISEMWYFVPIAIVNSVFPSIVQAKEIGETVYYGRIQKLFNLMSVISYSVAIPITFLSGFIITLIYGNNYAEAGEILTIHIWAGVFVTLGVARSTWLTTENLMKFSAATTAVGAVINIILNSLFIGTYGAVGAAWATVVSQVFASYLAGAFYPQTRRIFWSQTKAITLLGLIRR
ncbi:MAG: flippase [Oscillatoria sp. PMC 1068.18]|nr:flippase [Oscillatoria sp. PMC 1068.18]